MASALFRLVRRKSRLELDGDREKSKEIDRRLQNDRKRHKKEIKVLLLGAADGGKSTIIKQMRIINHGGFGDEERRWWKNIIFRNLVDSFAFLLDIMETQETDLEDAGNTRYRPLLLTKRDIGGNEDLPPEYFDCFQSLWVDTGIQLAILKAVQSVLSANLVYFMDNLERLFKANYLPSNKDILYARSSTIGIVERKFKLENHIYRMVDVGGQQSERRKWIEAFDGVNAVLFVAAISAYDQFLPEDPDKSQMEDALVLFEEISNSATFKQAALILFLNKIDLLKEKLQNGLSPLRRIYPDYQGSETDVPAGQAYFANKFKSLYQDTEKKKLYIHFTNATDTRFLDITMKSVQTMILQHNLKTFIL